MKKYLIIAMLICIVSTEAAAQDGPVPLSLQQAIKLAVENNLDVKAELFNTAMFEADIRGYRGIYDTLLSGFLNYQESTTIPTSTVLSGGTTKYEQKTLQYDAGVSQLLPTVAPSGCRSQQWIRNNSDPSRGFLLILPSDLVLEFTSRAAELRA